MRPNLITRLKEEWNNLDPVDPLRGLIADAIEALAEQPAISAGPITPAMMQGPTPEQKAQMVEVMSKLAEQPAPVAEPHKQQEPVGAVAVSHYKGLENSDFDYWGSLPDGTHNLYTSPPASKPWVGLSTSDLDEIDAPIRERGSATIAEIYRAIEAKLREKNA